MSHAPEEFDFEGTMEVLSGIAESATAEQQAAIELAANALHFVYTRNLFKEFREYLRTADLPAELVIRIEHTFADMTEASKWLESRPPPRHGTHVSIAGRTHVVWRDDDGNRILLPSFTPQELNERLKK
ncbi:hypothetical protein P2318_32180 [Myxococcaceae bacterium GXIMD 01537]